MHNDLVNNLKVARVQAVTTHTASANLTAVDTLGYQGTVGFILHVGAIAAGDATNYLAVTAEESDDNSTFTAITDNLRLIVPSNRGVVSGDSHGIGSSGELIRFNDAAGQATKDYFVGVTIGTKRYIRLVLTETGTASVVTTILSVLGGKRNGPVA